MLSEFWIDSTTQVLPWVFDDKELRIENKELVIYYSNRCPFTEYYVNIELVKLSEKYGIPLKIIKLEIIRFHYQESSKHEGDMPGRRGED